MTDKQSDEKTQSHDVTYTINRFVKNKWFVNTNVGLSKNTELGLDLRLSAGLAGGRNIL